MFSFFDNLFLYLAIGALILGFCAVLLSYLVGFIPALKPHALLIKVVGMALVISGGYYVADHRGYQRRVAEDQAEIDRLNAEARAKEAQLDKQKQATNVALRKAKDAIQSKQTILNSRIDAGELRLPSSCPVQASADARASTGDTTHASDTERQTIKDIVSIAADGDRAIESLNQCINFYNEVKGTVNVKP